MINILAIIRLAYLLTEENGPFDVFKRIRAYFGLIDVEDGGVVEKIKVPQTTPLRRTIADLLECKWCASVWAAMLVTIFALVPYLYVINYVLGASMAAIFLIEAFERLKGL